MEGKGRRGNMGERRRVLFRGKRWKGRVREDEKDLE